MTSLQDLIAQKEALERQIEETQSKDRNDAIDKIRALMSEYGLSAADVALKRVAKPRDPKNGSAPGTGGKGSKVPAKYQDKSTGDTWSGRGLQPKWLKAALASGKKIADFAV